MSENWAATEEGVLVIKKKYGIFDFKKLYKVGKEWSEDNKYLWHEKLYTDKIKSEGHEIEVRWEITKKFSAFIKFQIDVDIHIMRMKPVKVGKETLEKGEIEVIIKSEMQMDYKKNWENSALKKFLRHLYINYMKKRELNKIIGVVWTDTYALQDKIKNILEQYTR